MTLESIKDLQKVIALCRKTGVSSITIDNVTIELGSEPYKPEPKARELKALEQTYAPGGITAETNIPMPADLTNDQLLYWSSGDDAEQ